MTDTYLVECLATILRYIEDNDKYVILRWLMQTRLLSKEELKVWYYPYWN